MNWNNKFEILLPLFLLIFQGKVLILDLPGRSDDNSRLDIVEIARVA
jgi:hypothetical protein